MPYDCFIKNLFRFLRLHHTKPFVIRLHTNVGGEFTAPRAGSADDLHSAFHALIFDQHTEMLCQQFAVFLFAFAASTDVKNFFRKFILHFPGL